jgi:hypothetical protein
MTDNDGIEATATSWPDLIVDGPPVGIPIAVGDRVSWMGALHFGTVPVRWVGRIVGLGYGVPSGYAQGTDGEIREVLPRRDAARVEASLPQHGKTEVLVHETPIIVPLDELTPIVDE